MIKFFRHIRKSLIEQNKMGKYFKYSIGEIILVVIGILIALQVSNWNQDRQERNNINAYYGKLIEEIDEQIKETEQLLNRNDTLRKMQQKVLEILASKDESQAPELSDNLGSVATAWPSRYSFEVFDEFNQNKLLSKVSNSELKLMLEELKWRLQKIQLDDDFLVNQYYTSIEPYFARHINYSTVALPVYSSGFVEGGPEMDYTHLFQSMELWNVVTLKLETTNSQIKKLQEMQGFLKILKVKLKDEFVNA